MALEVQPRLRGYRIEAAIGRTPIAYVFRGRRVAPPRAVLIKFLPTVPAGLGAAARTQSELAVIGALRHPNAIHVEDWGEVDGVFYVVTEGEPEESVAELLADGVRFDRAMALALLEGVAAVMDEAHAMGITHGSLEPAVIKLTNDGMPLVADFALARLSNASPVPGSGGVRYGSTAYVAPERALGDPVGPPADVYAFAAIAYELLTGSAPYAEPGTSAVAQLYAHVNQAPPLASHRDLTLPEAVDDVLLGGLAKDPAQRWSTCGALLQALTAALAPAMAAPRRRRRLWPVLLRVAIVVGVAIAALFLIRPPLPGGLAQLRPTTVPSVPVTGEPSTVPSAAPTEAPAPAPSSAPTPAAPPTSTPIPPPPGPRPGQAVRLGAASVGRAEALTVSGSGFDPAGKYTINVVQQASSYEVQPATQVPANGAFTVKVFMPGQLLPGPATITACGSSASGQNCVQQAVTIT